MKSRVTELRIVILLILETLAELQKRFLAAERTASKVPKSDKE